MLDGRHRRTICYHETPSGHRVKLDLSGSKGPVLITFHGGGIVRGCRTEERLPINIQGVWISADYRLLTPSTGRDIVADVDALFQLIITLPMQHHRIILSGNSGGGYPLRLAAIAAARESLCFEPRFTVIGCVSYSGMGGDFLLDHWVCGAGSEDSSIESGEATAHHRYWQTSKEEYSDRPVAKEPEQSPNRNDIWTYWGLMGTINDSLTGDDGLSHRLRSLPYAERLSSIPTHFRDLYPSTFFAHHGSILPPFLLFHGDQDEAVPYAESVRTCNEIRGSGGVAQLVTVPGRGHNLTPPGWPEDTATQEQVVALEWMLERLRVTEPRRRSGGPQVSA